MSKTFHYVILILSAMAVTAVHAGEPLCWTGWSDGLFARAKAQNRFVILDLEAVWCHWCHVMDQNTYSNPKVQALLRAKYIPVRVDQDSDPALSTRYGDWGWPATIVFGPGGEEIVKLRGYVEPDRMVAMLQAIIDDPTPGPSVDAEPQVVPSASSTLSKSERAVLAKSYDESYDAERAGWGETLK
jgi:thioredoxin-related protein